MKAYYPSQSNNIQCSYITFFNGPSLVNSGAARGNLKQIKQFDETEMSEQNKLKLKPNLTLVIEDSKDGPQEYSVNTFHYFTKTMKQLFFTKLVLLPKLSRVPFSFFFF